MRIALKLILATVFGILTIFMVFGIVRANREMALFDSDIRKDHRLIGSTLGLCVANTWNTAGPDNAIDLVAQSDADRPDLRIGWIYADGRQSARAPVLSPLEVPPNLEIDQQVRRPPQDEHQEFLVTRIPVRHGSAVLGMIEIAENLAARNAYLRTSAWNTVIATGLMVFVAGLVVLVLGVWMVGKPLQLVTEKARRIGLGDLTGALAIRQKDEIGQLATEVNAMCVRIQQANERTAAESAARIQAVEQLRHADRLVTVGRLAAGIAHELGTPLNVVLGRLKMLRRGNLEASTTAEYLDEATEQVNLMTTIIRQLVDFARPREPKVVETDLQSIARSVVRLVEPLTRKRNIGVVVTSDTPTTAEVDPMQISQVLSNLLINAVHASNEGGQVSISVGGWSDGISTAQGDKREAVFVSVSDDGQGMSHEVLHRIFEPFFTTKDVGQGTGLGLSVAHGIVRDHGGSILVESQLGQGSTFTVILPAMAAT